MKSGNDIDYEEDFSNERRVRSDLVSIVSIWKRRSSVLLLMKGSLLLLIEGFRPRSHWIVGGLC